MGNTEISAIGLIGISAFLIGSVMIWVVSFRTHKAWGWSTLLLPVIGPLAYSLSHIKKSKEGLIAIVLGGLVIAFDGINSGWWSQIQQSAMVTAALEKGNDQAARLRKGAGLDTDQTSVKPSKPKAEEKVDVAKTRKAVTIKSASGQKAKPPTTTVVTKKSRVQVYKDIDVAKAQNYIGTSVRITDLNNKSHEATITGLRDQMVVFEKSYAGQGSVVFEVKKRDIKKMEAIAWTTKVERSSY